LIWKNFCRVNQAAFKRYNLAQPVTMLLSDFLPQCYGHVLPSTAAL
jgi:hypothetical protein